jgi:hypothetical protein
MEISRIRAQQTRLMSARDKLSRLMPFDEWCRTVNPTESAKEIYQFVRLTLESELERSRRAYADACGASDPHGTGSRWPRPHR